MQANLFDFDYYYKIYLSKCQALAETLVIHSSFVANAMNDYVERVTLRDVSPDKKTWRYYKNIAGQYHALDEPMKITSVDTLEEIIFNKENLALHRATYRDYQYGSRLYDELVARYPNQEILILGILYPADIDKAINAQDGDILSYPKDLVEKNEYSFIDSLQKWIKGFLHRRRNLQYGFSDEYYPISELGILYVNLLPAILTIRKSNCKTNEAHSYHVGRYLASHGFLDEYLQVLTLKQSLRFYMNINWVERNLGKTETQKWLIKEVMTERNLPIAEYDFKHDTSSQPEEIYPTNYFKKNSLNGLEYISEEDDLSLHQLLLKEDPLASENPVTRIDYEEDIDKILKNSLSNSLKTKVLESKVIDYTNANYASLNDQLLNCWADWSASNVFSSIVYFDDPVLGQRRNMSTKDAFILYIYAYYKQFNITLERIPDVKVDCVPFRRFLTREEIRGMGEHTLTKTEYGYLNYNRVEESFITDLLNSKVPITRMISIEKFYDTVKEVNRVLNDNLRKAYGEDDYILRGYKTGMVYRMYYDRYIHFGYKAPDGGNMFYKSFIADQYIDFSNFTNRDFGNLAKSIFNAATGVDLNNTNSLRNVHKAMVKLLKQLSSYSVQFIEDINESDIIVLEIDAPSTSKPVHYSEELIYFEVKPPKILEVKSKGDELLHDDLGLNGTEYTYIGDTGHEEVKAPVDIVVVEGTDSGIEAYIDIDLNAWVDDDLDAYYDKIKDKTSIIDFYGNDFRFRRPCETRQVPIIKQPLPNTDMTNGFKYLTAKPLPTSPAKGFNYIFSPTQGFRYIEPTTGGFVYKRP